MAASAAPDLYILSETRPRVVAVVNQKGGVGKTTTAINLAAALAERGRHVLLIDLDPQANSTSGLGVDPARARLTVYQLLAGEACVDEVAMATSVPGLFLVPSQLALAGAEIELATMSEREHRLRRALEQLEGGFGHVLIDCPPSLGLLTVNALVAADHALITAEAQYFALQGVEQAIEVIEIARDSLNDELSLLGVLLNLADMRTVHSREALASLKERFGEKVFDTVVRSSIAYAESAERAVSILDHRPDLGADYIALAGEVLGRLPGMSDASAKLTNLSR
jgi:chromosome partitioning protein